MTNWVATIKIKDLLSDNDDQARAVTVGKDIATRIEFFAKKHPVLTDNYPLDDVVLGLQSVNTVTEWESLCDDDPETPWDELPPITELNNSLNELYDWCDANFVWVD